MSPASTDGQDCKLGATCQLAVNSASSDGANDKKEVEAHEHERGDHGD